MDSFQARQADQDVIVFMGNGPSTQVISERAATCPRIRLLPAVPPQELLRWTASADYGVCFIEDSCLSYRYCLPNKLFEYMMAGIPVLASNTIDVRRLVEKEGIGVVAKENSVAGFDEALDRLLQTDPSKWRENARRASTTYCWEQQEARLMSAYAGL
jgi:glycosyltransferase involved in cell wall biosynthesis